MLTRRNLEGFVVALDGNWALGPRSRVREGRGEWVLGFKLAECQAMSLVDVE